jgi:alpha-beta hydrolase superfamily lysophospholipase
MSLALLASAFLVVGVQSPTTQSHGSTTSRLLASLDAAQVTALHTQLLGTQPKQATGVRAYKLSYPSPNSPPGYRRLSGALFLPTDLVPRGLVVYCHGTSAVEVPSGLFGEALLASAPFLSRGFAVAMPDYPGQGDSKGRHPYPLGRINAWSAIDIVTPARRVAADLGLAVERDLYVTGYSEGGAVAMWVARHAQENPSREVRFDAAAPLAGPYDVSRSTAQSLLNDSKSPVDRAIRTFLVAYLGYSAEEWAPRTSLSDIFEPRFARQVVPIFRTSKTNEEVTRRVVAAAQATLGSAPSIRPLLRPAKIAAFRSRDLRDPLVRTLAANDTFDWAPRLPMLLVALNSDTVVSAENTREAVRAMRRRGVPESLVRVRYLTADLNHVSAMPPSLELAAEFFESVDR